MTQLNFFARYWVSSALAIWSGVHVPRITVPSTRDLWCWGRSFARRRTRHRLALTNRRRSLRYLPARSIRIWRYHRCGRENLNKAATTVHHAPCIVCLSRMKWVATEDDKPPIQRKRSRSLPRRPRTACGHGLSRKCVDLGRGFGITHTWLSRSSPGMSSAGVSRPTKTGYSRLNSWKISSPSKAQGQHIYMLTGVPR